MRRSVGDRYAFQSRSIAKFGYVIPDIRLGFLTVTSENLFRTVLEMQPRDVGEAAGVGMSREDKVKSIIEDLMDKLPEEFNVLELMTKVDFPNSLIDASRSIDNNFICVSG